MGRQESNTPPPPSNPSPRLQGKTRSLVLRSLPPHKLRPHEARHPVAVRLSRVGNNRHGGDKKEYLCFMNRVKEGNENKSVANLTAFLAKH